jgi:hypothetical protein
MMTPADSYHEALNSHRHYDTMANAALSLIGAAIAGGPALYGLVSKHLGAELVLVFTSVVVHFSVQTYRRFDSYAGIALSVASAIEKNDERFLSPPIGFATVFASISQFPDLISSGASRTFKRIRVIGYSAASLFIVAAITIFVARLIRSF